MAPWTQYGRLFNVAVCRSRIQTFSRVSRLTSCGISSPINRSKRLFNTTTNNTDSSKDSRYKQVTSFSFKDYYEWFNGDISYVLNQNYIPIAKNNILPNIANKNNYLEIGCGHGVVLNELAPLFNKNICIMDANPFMLNHAKDTLSQTIINDINITTINEYIDDDDSSLINNIDIKFDFINFQNVLWHIQINKWENVFNKLYNLLNKNGKLVISHLDNFGVCYEICKYFYPNMETNNAVYVKNYFENRNDNKKEFNIEIIKDKVKLTAPESMTVQMFKDFNKTVTPTYNPELVGIYSDMEQEIIIKDLFKKLGCYEKEIDKNVGEYMVNSEYDYAHTVITKI